MKRKNDIPPFTEPDDDDAPRGLLLSRKEALRVLAGAGALALAGARWSQAADTTETARVCVAKPEMTEGPFFIDTGLRRSDIRVEPSDGSITPGATLDLHFNVSELRGESCIPLAGAVVDVWHCDALGVYSGVQDRNGNSVGKKFLRGHQYTDKEGHAHFTTIYPGWYRGRAVHIHFKIHSAPDAAQTYAFASQLFFDEALTDNVHATDPYAANGLDRPHNESDGIFRRGGDQLILNLAEKDGDYAAEFNIAILTGGTPSSERSGPVGLDDSDSPGGPDRRPTGPPSRL